MALKLRYRSRLDIAPSFGFAVNILIWLSIRKAFILEPRHIIKRVEHLINAAGFFFSIKFNIVLL